MGGSRVSDKQGVTKWSYCLERRRWLKRKSVGPQVELLRLAIGAQRPRKGLEANAECNEAGKGVRERQRGGVANLVLLLHNPLSISLVHVPRGRIPGPLMCLTGLMANHAGLPLTR
jgi:hypothetical protein